MKSIKSLFLLSACLIVFKNNTFAQNTSEQDKMLAELSENGCKCLEKINKANKSKEEVLTMINECIADETNAYHLGKQLLDIEIPEDTKDKDTITKNINITIGDDSPEYQTSYQEVENYLMANCKELKNLLASNDEENSKSVSNNREALEWYDKGIKQMEAENNKKAITYFKKALEIDSQFAFAWDNLGLCYRKMEDYENAINCYKKSIEIDPNGMTPRQNLAVAYSFQKEYELAIEAYEGLAELDEDNPEIYYGIGVIYTIYLQDLELGLTNMCKAYNLYTEMKSPYRTDAEKLIQAIYAEMKKQGKEDRFNEILKEYNITPQ